MKAHRVKCQECAKQKDAAAMLIAFAAWLTTRDKAVTFGAAYDAAPAAELVEAFRLSQNLPEPKPGWEKQLLSYPTV